MKSRRLPKTLIALAVCGLLLGVYAYAIEPYWIETTHHTLRAPEGVKLTAPIKIAHLTDLHTSGMGRREKKLLAILELEKPDVIVITGDSIGAQYKDTRPLLTALHAPLGVYLVRGNWENWTPIGNERAHYKLTHAILLLNEGAAPRPDVWLAGVDDPSTGSPNMAAALANAPDGSLRIGLFHSPSYFDSVAARLHFAFAGHSHGGQIRIPFLPALWLPHGIGRYVAGWYELTVPGYTSRMYVSRGIGTSIAPFRFASRPEVAFITLTPADSSAQLR